MCLLNSKSFLKTYSRRIQKKKRKLKPIQNLLHLPEDVILLILMKIGTLDIMFTAPLVCSSWRKLSKDPLLYRSIVIARHDYVHPLEPQFIDQFWIRVSKEAVRRSCGKMVEFSCEDVYNFAFKDIQRITNSTDSLKSLRLGSWSSLFWIQVKEILDAVKRLRSLEELFLHDFHDFEVDDIKEIGLALPKLECFRMASFFKDFDIKALAIAKSMPLLRCLYLQGNGLTNTGIEAILNGCPYLEYFYVKGSSNIQGSDLLKKNRSRIKSMRIVAEDRDTYGQEYEFYFNFKPSPYKKLLVRDYGLGDYGMCVLQAPFQDAIVHYLKEPGSIIAGY